MLNKYLSAFAACAVGASGALAADLPSKKSVPAPVVDEPMAIHGYLDFTVANTRVTGGGVLIYPRGSLFQTEAGLSLDLYKGPGFINSVTVFTGAWSESWTSPPTGGRHWQEVDWSQLLPQLPRFVGMLLVVAFSSSLDVAAIEMELGERAWRGRERGRCRLLCGVPTPSPLPLTPLPVRCCAPLAPFPTQAYPWITTESCRRSVGPTL